MRALGLVIAMAGCGRVGFDAAGDGGASPTGDGAGGDSATATFFDPFERSDSATLGNGWIEATPAAFSIQNGRVTRTINGDWTVNHVYRAPSEDLTDVEISLEFVLDDLAAPDWPQIFVRGEPSTFAGYYLWIELGPTTFGTPIDIARKGPAESWWTAIATMTAPAGVVGERYRLRLSATGANPVQLAAHYEHDVGGTWTDILTLSGMDSDPNAIVGAGTWGFDGHTGTASGPYTYDNFTANAL